MLLEVLEVLLEIEIYLLDPFCKHFLSSLNLDFSDLGPLIIELRFQEFTRLDVELDDFFWAEVKFHIKLLEFELEIFLFLLLLNTYHPLHSSNQTSSRMIFFLKRIRQIPISNLKNLALDILNNRLQLE